MGSSCWLGAQVTPNDDGQTSWTSINNPSRWFVLDESTDDKVWDRNLPIVVRLSGSPLVTLPTIDPDAASLGADGRRLGMDLVQKLALDSFKGGDENRNEGLERTYAVEHSVLLDEYAAMRNVASDFTRAGDPGNSVPGRLPFELALGKELAPRFWVALGVQLSDGPVRHTLSAQMFAPRWLSQEQARDPRYTEQVMGVAVNTRVEQEALGLLYWSGCDIVAADCHEFEEELGHVATHLRHYAEVLAQNVTVAKTLTTADCDLP